MLLALLLSTLLLHVTFAKNTIACVTGASGYLGMELTAQLLNMQYVVRGTVRDPNNQKKTAHLRALPFAKDHLTLLKADLLGGPEAFTDCVQGADVLFHTASPFATTNIKDPMKDLVEPALRGTEAAVGAALQSSTVQKIILTSSIAATMAGAMGKDGDCFHQHDWNTASSLNGNGLDAYRYSKTVAEKKFWELLQDKKTNPRRITGAAINPSFIIGPPRNARTDGESTTYMSLALSGILPYRGNTPMCDVRDVATAHIKAATVKGGTGGMDEKRPKTDVANHRFIVSSARWVQRASVLSWLREKYATFDIVVGQKIEPPSHVIFCPSNFQTLDMKLRDPKSSILDMAKRMIELESVVPTVKEEKEL